MKAPVEVSSSFPISIEIDADRLGEIFATLASDEQVSVLRAMAEHMRPHSQQWDYIAIELELPENTDVLQELRRVLFPEESAE